MNTETNINANANTNTNANANANALVIKEKLFIKADLTRLEEYVIKNEPIIKRKLRYYPNPNIYPNPTTDPTTDPTTNASNLILDSRETDEELFNNLFDVHQIHRINRFKKYIVIFIFLGAYVLMGYMYYKFIYIN